MSLLGLSTLALLSAPVGASEPAATERLATHWDALEEGAPTLPESSAELPVDGLLHVTVTTASVSVEGEVLFTFVEGQEGGPQVPADQLRGQVITPLYDVLHERVDEIRIVGLLHHGPGEGDFKGRVELSMDADVPFTVVRKVMYTAGQAQFGVLRFLVRNPWLDEVTVIESELPSIGPPAPLSGSPPGPPILNLSIAIDRNGLTVLGADAVLFPDGAPEVPVGQQRPATVPCVGGGPCDGLEDYDWAGFSEVLGRIKDRYPDDLNVIVVPAQDVAFEVIARTLDVARWAPLPPGLDEGSDAHEAWQSERREMFGFSVIAGGAL